ncbi:hypothetical protein EXIGLDRAFT_834534 [Exidia glandulosa HHB12029]|uniref:Uncharacterized protein n=1 Tax=Exidia glandulosa HHB12029 TaxID=1314781 RepID=A0A165JMC4_EXIGL|nr:hypothetical protein EXIGLDRAFT_834534 [Exidia glandulosa HHB12029]
MSLVSQVVGTSHAAAVTEAVVLPLFGAARGIAVSAVDIRVNKETALALARRVDQLVSSLALTVEEDSSVIGDEATQDAITRMQTVLADIHNALKARAAQSYISQLLRQEADSETLRVLSASLKDAFDVLTVSMHMRLNGVVTTTTQAREASDAFNALQFLPDVSPHNVDAQLLTRPALPTQPQLYFGRAPETQLVVGSVIVPVSSYVCILGGPGIGKTSLALAVFHSPAVVGRYGRRRYFVSCEGADDRLGVLPIVAAAFGITNFTRATAKAKLTATFADAPALLVLDNFESVWDPPGRSTDVEDDLAYFCSITGLSLIVTLRGSERPQGVPWTRPFLPPLQPLDDAAARQLFVSISDVVEDSVQLDRLLSLFDNIPLAISLAACLAQYQPISSLLAQWNDSKSSMLRRNDGRHRLTSLDASIALSIESSRMQQAQSAIQLLSLLSLLPHGAFSTDISLWAGPLPEVARAISTLIQNALAWRTSDNRIRVLAPIREYMLLHHPPNNGDARLLYDFYFGVLTSLSPNPLDVNVTPEAKAVIAPELENIRFLMLYALDHSADLDAPIAAAVALCNLFNVTGLGSPDVLHPALAAARKHRLGNLTADLLFTWGTFAYNSMMPGDAESLFREALPLFEQAGDVEGRIRCTFNLSTFTEPSEAVTECQRMMDLAGATGCNERLLLRCQTQLATAYQQLHEFDKARRMYERVTIAYKAMGKAYDRLRGYNMICMAEIDIDTGGLTTAIAVLRDAVEILLAARSPNVEAALAGLGSAYLLQGDGERAVEALERLLSELRSSGNMARSFEPLYYLTSAYLFVGDMSAAATTVALAKQLSTSLTPERIYERGRVLQSQGQLAFAENRLNDARTLLRMAITLTRSHDYRANITTQLEADVWEVLGQVQQHGHMCEDALSSFVVAALLRRRIGQAVTCVRALARLAQVVDDDETSKMWLVVVTLPLQRYGCRTVLAECLAHSGTIAARQGTIATARHRWESAMRHFVDMKDSRGMESTAVLLATL